MKGCPRCPRAYEDTQDFCTDDGEPLFPLAEIRSEVTTDPHFSVPGTELSPGTKVGEYVIERQIGAGGMGVIYSAVHPVIGKKVAVKLLHPAMAHNPEVVQRFVTEAKAVNQIGHRNIVDIFAFGALPDDRHYFVMEFLEGESLADRLARGPLAPGDALPIWIQAASAIEAAHGRGIVHRDLKPDNIFLCPSVDGPFVKVLDFGIAKLLGDAQVGVSVTSTGVPMGTPLYMSPEQATGAKIIDHRTDLYAFGIILYETIAQLRPFRGNSFIEVLSAQIAEAPQALSEQCTIELSLERLVDQLMHKDPDGRPPGMGAVRTRLIELRNRMLAGEVLWTPGVPSAQRAQSPSHARTPPTSAARAAVSTGSAAKRPATLAAAIAVTMAVAGVGTLALSRSRHADTSSPKTTTPAAVPSPTPPVVLAPPAPAATEPRAALGRVVVSTNAVATQIFLDRPGADGAVVLARTPVAAGGMSVKFQVPADVDLILRIEAEGFVAKSMPLRIGAGDETALPVVLTPAKLARPAHKAAVAKSAPAVTSPKPAAGDNSNLVNPF